LQNVRVLRRQAGRRHGEEGKSKRLTIHPSTEAEAYSANIPYTAEDFPKRATAPEGLFCVASELDFPYNKESAAPHDETKS
jgi:hypothetical protein